MEAGVDSWPAISSRAVDVRKTHTCRASVFTLVVMVIYNPAIRGSFHMSGCPTTFTGVGAFTFTSLTAAADAAFIPNNRITAWFARFEEIVPTRRTTSGDLGGLLNLLKFLLGLVRNRRNPGSRSTLVRSIGISGLTRSKRCLHISHFWEIALAMFRRMRNTLFAARTAALPWNTALMTLHGGTYRRGASELAEMVNDIKRTFGSGPNGPFYINEYKQVVVPVGEDARYYLAGPYDQPVKFEFDGKTISGEPVRFDGQPLQPGETWVGPHAGIPYVLTANCNDVYYKTTPSPNVERPREAKQGAWHASGRAGCQAACGVQRPWWWPSLCK